MQIAIGGNYVQTLDKCHQRFAFRMSTQHLVQYNTKPSHPSDTHRKKFRQIKKTRETVHWISVSPVFYLVRSLVDALHSEID